MPGVRGSGKKASIDKSPGKIQVQVEKRKITKTVDAFAPVAAYRNKMVVYKLPESIWSAGILVVLMNDWTLRTIRDVFFDFVPIFIAIGMTVVIQLVYIQELIGIVDDRRDSASSSPLDGENLVLIYCCIATLVATVQGGDLRDSLNTIQWIRLWPGGPCCGRRGDEKPRFQVKHRVFEIYEQSFDYWIPDGYIDIFTRMFFFTGLLGRMALSFAVIIYGSAHVIYSEKPVDMILNTVGVLFILDLDDIFYLFAAPAQVKSLLEQLPPIGMSVFLAADENVTLMTWFLSSFGTWLNWLAFVLLTFFFVYFWHDNIAIPIVVGVPVLLLGSAFSACNLFRCRRVDGGRDDIYRDAKGLIMSTTPIFHTSERAS